MIVKKDNLYINIKNILQVARDTIYKQANFIMVEACWNISKQVVEEEQNGEGKAKYSLYLIKKLSKQLASDFGKGFTQQNLRNMRQFYNCFPIRSALCSKLTWSHYRLIIRVENQNVRQWYINEVASLNWSARALERQISTHYYERILASKGKQIVQKEAENNTKDLLVTQKNIIKDSCVLEFLDLKDNIFFRKSELESPLIKKIQEFLLELGKGFAFVARQRKSKLKLVTFCR